MEEINILQMDWHDAVLESIMIDRKNPGKKDNIEFIVEFQEEERYVLRFENVYYSLLDLNFGVVIEQETIYSFRALCENDIELKDTISKWKKYYPEVVNILGFEIKTNSTYSRIVIIACDAYLSRI